MKSRGLGINVLAFYLLYFWAICAGRPYKNSPILSYKQHGSYYEGTFFFFVLHLSKLCGTTQLTFMYLGHDEFEHRYSSIRTRREHALYKIMFSNALA